MLNDFPLLIIDESTDARLIEALSKEGYKVFSVQQEMHAADDIDIIKVAFEKGGYIITEDKDFGDELVYRKAFHHGAMLLRLHGLNIEDKTTLVISALKNHSEELPDAFAVLNKNKLRIRK